MTYSLVDPDTHDVQVRKPDVPGDLVAGLAPYALLGIERWLVRGKIFKMKLGVALHKELHFFSSVPGSPVYIKPNMVTAQLAQHVTQYFQKPLPVAGVCSYQSLLPQQRGYPTKQIKPFAVLAIGSYPKSPPYFGPTPPQTRMKAETSLILKDDRLIGIKTFQFFLTPARTCGHPQHEPECRRSWLFSGYSPIGASTSGLAEPLASHQSVASSELPVSARPRQAGADQTPAGSSPDVALAVAAQRVSVGSGAPHVLSVSRSRAHPGSRHESSAPQLRDSTQVERLPVPAASLPEPARERRPLCRLSPPGPALPTLTVSPWSRPAQSKLKLS